MSMEAMDRVKAVTVSVDTNTDTDTDGEAETACARAAVARTRATSARDDEPTHYYVLICDCCGTTYGIQLTPPRRSRCTACVALRLPPRYPVQTVLQEQARNPCAWLPFLLVAIVCIVVFAILFVLVVRDKR